MIYCSDIMNSLELGWKKCEMSPTWTQCMLYNFIAFEKFLSLPTLSPHPVPIFLHVAGMFTATKIQVLYERLLSSNNWSEILWSEETGGKWGSKGKISCHFQVFHIALLVQFLVVFDWRHGWQNDCDPLIFFFSPWQCKASPETLILLISTVAQQEAELVRDLSLSLTTAAPRGPHFFSSFSEIPVQKNSVMSPADQFVSVARASMRMQKVKQKLDSVTVSQI